MPLANCTNGIVCVNVGVAAENSHERYRVDVYGERETRSKQMSLFGSVSGTVTA